MNRQFIEITGDGRIHYRGGETPVHHPREKEIVDTALKSVTVLGCQGYAGVDVVVADKVYVVDVNPRITTSIIGIAATMDAEIADILVRASKGETPGEPPFQPDRCFRCEWHDHPENTGRFLSGIIYRVKEGIVCQK